MVVLLHPVVQTTATQIHILVPSSLYRLTAGSLRVGYSEVYIEGDILFEENSSEDGEEGRC